MGLSSIEQCFERIANALEHIAVALEQPEGPPGEHAQPMLKEMIARSMNDALPLPTGAGSVIQSATISTVTPATYEETQAAVVAYIGVHGHAAGKELLAQFGARFVKSLAPEQYGAVVAKTRETA
jgi:hypothetical protein